MTTPKYSSDDLIKKTAKLFTLPTVAIEVIQLTNNPHIEADALKQVLEKDPALMAKILRVVNSDQFGLSREVGSLNEALGLLGTKPLQMLVLGFSLPEEWFEGLTKKALQSYWTDSLVRAVSARLICKRFWPNVGDEAFITSMLYDIGMLSFFQEYSPVYGELIDRSNKANLDLLQVEKMKYGFDHIEISASLLETWKLPRRMVETVQCPKIFQDIARRTDLDAPLCQAVHLACLFTDLIANRKLGVLPELMEAGEAYCGLTRTALSEIVAELQPGVDQMAQNLSVQLAEDRDYQAVLVSADERISELLERQAANLVPGGSLSDTEEDYQVALEDTHSLLESVESFFENSKSATQTTAETPTWTGQHASHQQPTKKRVSDLLPGTNDFSEKDLVIKELKKAAKSCRSRRCELSLLVLSPAGQESPSEAMEPVFYKMLDKLFQCVTRETYRQFLFNLDSDRGLAILLFDTDRRAAVELVKHLNFEFEKTLEATEEEQLEEVSLCTGIATVHSIPKNFDTERLWESAIRCLQAAIRSGGNNVKSIEVC